MKPICVCTILIGDLPYKDAAKKNHREYCAHHSYAYICLERALNDYHPMWMKPDLILQVFSKKYEYVFFTDGDSFFINMDRALEDFICDKDLIASGDENDLINTGHLFFKNTAWSKSFIKHWIKFRRPL